MLVIGQVLGSKVSVDGDHVKYTHDEDDKVVQDTDHSKQALWNGEILFENHVGVRISLHLPGTMSNGLRA